MKTKLYNTFIPSERDQDASGAAGRGGKLLLAEDLGPVTVVESDNATARKSGVQQAIRRALFFRPAMMVVHDGVLLSEPELGVQSWNSFRQWQIQSDRGCIGRGAMWLCDWTV